MNDDWRLEVDLHESGFAHALRERLDATDLEHRLETSFADRVVVTVDGPVLFCYAGSQAQLQAAEQLIRGLAAEKGWQADCELTRWHAEAEAWEPADRPLPASPQEQAAEHEELIAREREEVREQGYPDFEVRVQCRTEGDCAAFAARLEAEGVHVVRRGKFLLVGAPDEDTAQALAARFHREAPEGSAVLAEGSVPSIYAGRPFNPFALFGGLGG